MEYNDAQEEHLSQLSPKTSLVHSVTHPAGTIYRAIGLILLCCVGFGPFFCSDLPASLQDKIGKDLNLSTSQYVLLYSVYSWPNVILGFIGGFLIDRVFGIRLATNLYSGLTLLGQICFSAGIWCETYWLMLVGRFIFGIGSESLCISQNTYSVLWFKGKVLNMVLGLQICFGRVGSSITFMVMETLYNFVGEKYKGVKGLAITSFIATITCVFSLICSLLLGIMDKKAEKILRVNEHLPSAPVRISDIWCFDGRFWLVIAICVFHTIAIFPFFTIGKSFFVEHFHMNEADANYICSTVYLISALASAPLGFLIDKIGRNLIWIIVGVFSSGASHVCLAFFTSINPYIPMSLLGISYSIINISIYTCISYVIPEHQLGTAYGVTAALQNVAFSIFTSVVGVIVDNAGYVWTEISFIGNLLVALIATLAVLIWDFYDNGIINMTPTARLAKLDTKKHESPNIEGREANYVEIPELKHWS